MNEALRPAPASRLLERSLPRYASLAGTLAEEIAAGQVPVGSLLPTEQALGARFGVSRATVREALRRLREMGLVAGSQGVGTRVVARHPAAGYEMAVQSLADLMGYAAPTVLVVRARERLTVGPALAALLGGAMGMEMLCLSGLRRAAGEGQAALSCVEMYVPAEFAAIADRPEVGRVPVYRLIERHAGLPLAAMQQDIAAIALEPAEARVLGVAEGSPGLRIVRRFLGPGDRLLEATVNIHAAAGKFCYRIRMAAPQHG